MKTEVLYSHKYYLKKVIKNHKEIKIKKVSKNKSILEYPSHLNNYVQSKLTKYHKHIMGIPLNVLDLQSSHHDGNNNESEKEQEHQLFKPHFKVLAKNEKDEHATTKATTKVVTHIPTSISTYFKNFYNYPSQQGSSKPTICIISLGGTFKTSDLNTYWTACGYSGNCPAITVVNVDGTTNNANQTINNGNSGASTENTLDIELAITMCPNANVRIYFGKNTNQGFYNAINSAYTYLNGLSSTGGAKIISISWGGDELSFDVVWASQYNTLFHTIQSAGISTCVASGDNACDDGTGVLSVDFPSSSPYVVACGGSSLNPSTGRETAWSYNSTYGWGGGGGCSLYFSQPSCQSGVVTYPTELTGSALVHNRSTPDIALNADPIYGWSIYFNGSYMTVGGTSAVAPAFSAFLGLCNKQSSLYSNTTNVLTQLYTASALTSPSCFNDITSGSNDDLTSTDGADFYKAHAGYDQCTGLGSIIGANLHSHL